MFDKLYLVWIPYTFAAIVFFYSFLRYNRSYEHTFKQKECHSPKIIFQIMTRGNIEEKGEMKKEYGNVELVQNNVNAIFDINKDLNYQNFEVHVVTDGQEKYDKALTINVPSEYNCKYATHKSRALQYAIELKTGIEEEEMKKTWILHLDEESRVTKNVILACLDFIEKNPDKLIGEGAINYPINFYKTQMLIPSFLEAERAFGCYFCCHQMTGEPIYLHGSNLLVRADLEYEIKWDCKTIAEDSCFGHRVSKRLKGKNIFGWTHGTLLEQPAFTIKDSIKQRKRWYYGSVQNLRYLDLKGKIIQISFLSVWTLGFVSGMIGLISIFGNIYVPEYLKGIFAFNIFVWLLMYQWGTWLNIRHLDISMNKRILTHIYCLMITPILGLISTLPAVLVFISMPKTFEIIKK